MSRVLVVDDEASICWALREFLADQGHEVDVASSAEEGLELTGRTAHDAVLMDVRLPGIDGISALGRFRERTGPAPIIVITAFGNLDTAVRAMEGGAFDYLVKPFDLDQAGTMVARALDASRGQRAAPANGSARGPEARGIDHSLLIGHSSPMQELFKQIALVAPTEVPVLITGESGTGKELVARAIHRHSGRRGRTFLPVCVAALELGTDRAGTFRAPPRLVHRADPGSQGAARTRRWRHGAARRDRRCPAAVQVKLLRAIEHREVTPVGDARPRPT